MLPRIHRESNGLSQRGAIDVMKEEIGMSLSSLQKWEIRKAKPGRFVAKAIGTFLDAHPVISDPPRYGRWGNPLAVDKVEEIRKLRGAGLTLMSIAQKIGISESSVSRIAKGNRRGGAGEQATATEG